ncbi:hypothetical protein H311_00585, partial [Anncaliia algerae PRA109]
MKLHDLIEKTTNEKDAIFCAEALGLISFSSKYCYKCTSLMRIEKHSPRMGFDGIWRCTNNLCRSTRSIFKNTIFENVHFSISTALRCIYLKCFNVSNVEIENQLGIKRKYIAKFFEKILKNIDHNAYECSFPKLGGPGNIIEVDETHIVSRRDNRGRIHPGERYWVLGLVCRNTKQIRMKLVRRRTADECCNFIKQNVNEGSMIYTDEWRGYNLLEKYNFLHKTV